MSELPGAGGGDGGVGATGNFVLRSGFYIYGTQNIRPEEVIHS